MTCHKYKCRKCHKWHKSHKVNEKCLETCKDGCRKTILINHLPVIIRESGNYAIKRDLIYKNKDCRNFGINIKANNVNIDLCGNTLSIRKGHQGSLIRIKGRKNINIKNGQLQGPHLVDHTTATDLDGIRLKDAHNVNVSGINFQNISNGIRVDTFENVTIRDCLFHGKADYHISTHTSGQNLLIENNLFTDSKESAVLLTAESGDTVVQNNIFTNMCGTGVAVAGSNGTIICGNTFRRCKIGVTTLENSKTWLTQNKFHLNEIQYDIPFMGNFFIGNNLETDTEVQPGC